MVTFFSVHRTFHHLLTNVQRAAAPPPGLGILGFEKQVATVAMSLVEPVVQWQGVATPTIHLHTVVNSGSKCALGVPLGRTQLSVVLGSKHRVERLLDVCSG
jgi:hypothetical protein